jgi:hypothetical protein
MREHGPLEGATCRHLCNCGGHGVYVRGIRVGHLVCQGDQPPYFQRFTFPADCRCSETDRCRYRLTRSERLRWVLIRRVAKTYEFAIGHKRMTAFNGPSYQRTRGERFVDWIIDALVIRPRDTNANLQATDKDAAPRVN